MVLTQTSLPGKRTVAQLSNDTGMSRPQIKNLRGIRETTSLFGKPSELSQIIRRQYGPPKPKDLSSNQAHISPGESANGADSNSPDPRIPRVLEDNQSPEQSQLGEPIVGYNELRRDMTRPLSTNSPAQWKGKARATYNVIDTSTIPRPINPVDLPIVGPIGLNPKLGGSNPQTVLREKLTPEDSASQTGQAPLSHVSQAVYGNLECSNIPEQSLLFDDDFGYNIEEPKFRINWRLITEEEFPEPTKKGGKPQTHDHRHKNQSHPPRKVAQPQARPSHARHIHGGRLSARNVPSPDQTRVLLEAGRQAAHLEEMSLMTVVMKGLDGMTETRVRPQRKGNNLTSKTGTSLTSTLALANIQVLQMYGLEDPHANIKKIFEYDPTPRSEEEQPICKKLQNEPRVKEASKPKLYWITEEVQEKSEQFFRLEEALDNETPHTLDSDIWTQYESDGAEDMNPEGGSQHESDAADKEFLPLNEAPQSSDEPSPEHMGHMQDWDTFTVHWRNKLEEQFGE
ncbi:uncharacterized protein C8R40DRAFT_1169841 [Lentinula edodes]|uniref:uncharacterized protein n=1 Tax=Lentinula edodes TaxID=5353 RepID=UPI001E8CC4AF|nr:uncharacterized protein C8R40DRAFT_1169841 [Lentinula edodes]KAH7876178.1 hypothetical protein C8R40DRAFT_1169841 [Lentinula edodes]